MRTVSLLWDQNVAVSSVGVQRPGCRVCCYWLLRLLLQPLHRLLRWRSPRLHATSSDRGVSSPARRLLQLPGSFLRYADCAPGRRRPGGRTSSVLVRPRHRRSCRLRIFALWRHRKYYRSVPPTSGQRRDDRSKTGNDAAHDWVGDRKSGRSQCMSGTQQWRRRKFSSKLHRTLLTYNNRPNPLLFTTCLALTSCSTAHAINSLMQTYEIWPNNPPLQGVLRVNYVPPSTRARPHKVTRPRCACMRYSHAPSHQNLTD